MSKDSSYRGRLAPSPTGYLHVGHARTFWTAFERARDAAGTLVMRMEDLDLQRSRPVYADAALEDLRWLGIEWQEGPGIGGPFAPYEQSRRRDLYLAAWRRLHQLGVIYPCRCSRKDLEAAIFAPHENSPVDEDDEPIYPGTCRPPDSNLASGAAIDQSDLSTPEGRNWRFAVPIGEEITYIDQNLGPQRFIAGRDFGDFLIWRRDGSSGSQRTGPGPWGIGMPSYQLACVVDDAAMQITEVVRGADLLKSTARQILLNRALGFENPAWFHCALVMNSQGQRLAKRHDALGIRTLRERGLTPAEILFGEIQKEA
jgi:glutamyl/glutaminyl-tRNA synthetase